jgi:hypothetical protein
MTVGSTALVPYSTLVQQFKAGPPGKLCCLHGTGSVFRLSLSAAAHVLLSGVPVTLVDGTNHFDVYYIAEFARRMASAAGGPSPDELLNNIFISRAFTCYQMEAVITERLPAFVIKKSSPLAIIFGLLDTFYDEQASLSDVRAGVRRIIGTLRQLKQAKISVLLASLDIKPASKERSALFPQVCSVMDEVYAITEEEGRPRIAREAGGEGREHEPKKLKEQRGGEREVWRKTTTETRLPTGRQAGRTQSYTEEKLLAVEKRIRNCA